MKKHPDKTIVVHGSLLGLVLEGLQGHHAGKGV